MSIELQGDEIFDTGAEAFEVEQSARRAVLSWLKNNAYKFHELKQSDQNPDEAMLVFRRIKNETDQTPIVLVGLPSVFRNHPAISVESTTVEESQQSTFTSVRTEIPEDDHVRLVICKKPGISHDFSFTSKQSNHVETYSTADIFRNGEAVEDTYGSKVIVNVIFIGIRLSDTIRSEPVGSLNIRVPLE